MSCPTLALDRSTLTALRRPPAATADAATADAAPADADAASDALAAIASTYEDARAGIISGERSSAVVPAGYSPTVPLTLLAKPEPPRPPQRSGALQTVTTLWSRLLRRVEPGRRGRHSATEAEGLPAEALQWGPPGRVRLLSQP